MWSFCCGHQIVWLLLYNMIRNWFASLRICYTYFGWWKRDSSLRIQACMLLQKNDWKKTMSVCFDWVQPSNSNNLEWLILFCAWPREKICMEIITSVTYKDNLSLECVFYCCFDHLVHEAVIENRNLCWFFACTRYTIVSQTNRNILWKLFCSNWKCAALLVAAKYVRVWVCICRMSLGCIDS